MAIYPTLFVLYLNRLFPWFAEGHRGVMVGLAVVIICALLNIAGVRVVSTTSLWLFFALSAPFIVIVAIAPFKLGALAHAVTTPTTSTVDILGGLLICMWNYMGWDNASTIATEVERPQRTYPRAMLAAVVIVALSYVVPVAAMWMTGLSLQCVGDRFLGGHRRYAGRSAAARRPCPGRHDQRALACSTPWS